MRKPKLREGSLTRVGGGGEHSGVLGHIRDVRTEWMSFPGRTPADGCNFFTTAVYIDHLVHTGFGTH